jgi:hypothetical protein
MTKLTPAQIEEFETTFRYFDKDEENKLGLPGFSAALASLGIVYSVHIPLFFLCNVFLWQNRHWDYWELTFFVCVCVGFGYWTYSSSDSWQRWDGHFRGFRGLLSSDHWGYNVTGPSPGILPRDCWWQGTSFSPPFPLCRSFDCLAG